MKPKRIQRSRAKGWKMPANTVYVGRPSKWGNPFIPGMLCVKDAADAVNLFKRALERIDLPGDHLRFVFTLERLRLDLGGKNLACWCQLSQPCHADILLKVANTK